MEGGGGMRNAPFLRVSGPKETGARSAREYSIARQYQLVVTALHVDSAKKQLIKSKERNQSWNF
jgi:hypothetical protein